MVGGGLEALRNARMGMMGRQGRGFGHQDQYMAQQGEYYYQDSAGQQSSRHQYSGYQHQYQRGGLGGYGGPVGLESLVGRVLGVKSTPGQQNESPIKRLLSEVSLTPAWHCKCLVILHPARHISC
jgi:hypothetical protein